MFVGPWVVLGSLAENPKENICRYVSPEFYVCRIKSVPKVVGVLIPIEFIYFCEQSRYPIIHKFVSEGWSGIFEI